MLINELRIAGERNDEITEQKKKINTVGKHVMIEKFENKISI